MESSETSGIVTIKAREPIFNLSRRTVLGLAVFGVGTPVVMGGVANAW